MFIMAGTDTQRPRVGVSSCLLGAEVRFNGGHKRYRFLTDELGAYVDWVPYCPEVEIGLGTPREPIRLDTEGRLVNRSGTADHTRAMAALPLPPTVDGYVFKAKSPSCGLRGIARYGPDGQASGATGAGLYAGRVMAADPLLAVEDEGRLNDPGLREAFVERLFAAARLRFCSPGRWSPLAWWPSTPGTSCSCSRTIRAGTVRPDGWWRARGRSRPRRRARRTGSCSWPRWRPGATPGRNANALQHAYSRIGRTLPQVRREDLMARIEAYRRGEVPLSVPVALLGHYASGGELPWLAEQTYLAPFPAQLRLRNTVPPRP